MEYESITVEQLYQEELDALEEQYSILINEGTASSTTAAQTIATVILYFKA